MGYTETTNYKLKKPDASNKFDVMDLNNALDAVDKILFDNITAQLALITVAQEAADEANTRLDNIKIIDKWM